MSTDHLHCFLFVTSNARLVQTRSMRARRGSAVVSLPGDHYQMDLHVLQRDPMGMNEPICIVQCRSPGVILRLSLRGETDKMNSSPQLPLKALCSSFLVTHTFKVTLTHTVSFNWFDFNSSSNSHKIILSLKGLVSLSITRLSYNLKR